MSRSILAALAASLLFSGAAFAGTDATEAQDGIRRTETRRYANTLERWQGRPALRAAGLAHPADEASPSEKVYEHVPSVNFMLEGQAAGGFHAPGL